MVILTTGETSITESQYMYLAMLPPKNVRLLLISIFVTLGFYTRWFLAMITSLRKINDI